MRRSSVIVGLNAVVVAVTGEVPRVLTVRRTGHALAGTGPGASDQAAREATLPFGPLDPEGDRTLELGLRAWVRRQAGLEVGYVEQLYTFGDRYRDPRERRGGPRVLSVAYLALVREGAVAGTGLAAWRDIYGFFPWEDWRRGRPAIIDQAIAPALRAWCSRAPRTAPVRARRERADIAFGFGDAAWDAERVLERYELLYEAGLVAEAVRDRDGRMGTARPAFGEPMALDHRRILATALGRLRGKIRYRPVVFELLAPIFTLLQLQRVVEALSGLRLHKQNFRRLVEDGGLVEGTGDLDTHTGGRPAELFRFRRDVLRERRAPGVGLPAASRRA
jgi:hypothetical protein